MTFDVLQLIGGLVLLVAGGRAMVSGAAALARSLGVTPLVIGITVVAFGTSAPELAVNTISALRGTGEVAFGNIMGSNLANVGLIVGAAAVVRPLAIQGIIIVREVPMMLLASVAALLLALDHVRGEALLRYDRVDAGVLMLFFAVFLYYTVGDTIRQRLSDPLTDQLESRRIPRIESLAPTLGLVAAGLVGLTLGGHFTVEGAIGLAEALAIPRSIVGLTIIAVGTSLPELTTSIVAAQRGETDLAVGNIVGSNIFNLLFVLPISAAIRPVPIPEQGLLDLAAVVTAAGLLWIVCSTHGGRVVTRSEGWLLLASYFGYMVARAT